MDAIAAGNEKLGLNTDEGVRYALDALGKDWTAEHDVVRGTSGRLDHLVVGPGGAFVVVTRHRAYRLEHLSRAKHHAARMHSELERWVTPVICLTMRDDTPHRRDGVWIMGAEHLVGWLRSRSDGSAGREG
jgi:hypothetical protein